MIEYGTLIDWLFSMEGNGEIVIAQESFLQPSNFLSWKHANGSVMYFTWKWVAIPSVPRGTTLFLKLGKQTELTSWPKFLQVLRVRLYPLFIQSYYYRTLFPPNRNTEILCFQSHWCIFPTLPCPSKSIHYAFLLLVCQPPRRQG